MNRRSHPRLPVRPGSELELQLVAGPAHRASVLNWSEGGVLVRVADFHQFLNILEAVDEPPQCTLVSETGVVEAEVAHIQWAGHGFTEGIDVGIRFNRRRTPPASLNRLANALLPVGAGT